MVDCNICGWKGKEFGPLHSPDQSVADANVFCPVCGSYERHRALASYLSGRAILPAGGRALEIGNGILLAYRKLVRSLGLDYVSLDLWPGFGTVTGDAASLAFANASFDVVFCSHVLEHVTDDLAALQEMVRVMKPDGLAVIQIPYADDRFGTVEHKLLPTLRTGSGYHFGHTRDYGLDVLERFGAFWLQALEVNPLLAIPEAEARRFGFEKNYGTFFFCTNSPAPLHLDGLLQRDLVAKKRRWMIERRAEDISRNGAHSDDLGNWLRAERELAALTDEQVRNRSVIEVLRGRGGKRR